MYVNTSSLNDTVIGPVNYPFLYQIISVVFGTIIFLIGLLGNILVVVVVCRTKSMLTPTNCYLISLSISDCIVLLSATLPSIPDAFFEMNQWNWGRVLCSLLVFLQYLGVDASSLSITAFTVERYIAICHPMRAQRLCTAKRAKRIIAGIWIFAVLYCSPWMGLTVLTNHPKRNIEICKHRLEREKYLAYYLTDLIAFYVIPLLISGLLYALIIRILFASNIPRIAGRKNSTVGGEYRQKKKLNSRKQVVRMLIAVVGLFAILWLPYRALVVYNSFSKKKYLDVWFLFFCRMMIYINSAINPILYNAMSVKFRRAFRKLLRCGATSQNNDFYTDISTDSRMKIHVRHGNDEEAYLMVSRKYRARLVETLRPVPTTATTAETPMKGPINEENGEI